MSRWSIHKAFEFDYAHRVHSQRLNAELSIDSCLACRHLHGHRGKVVVYLTSGELDDKGMVMDFKELNWFKKFLDDVLDHKMILDLNDPVLKTVYPLFNGAGNEHFHYGPLDVDYGPNLDQYLQYIDGSYYKIWEDLYKNLPTHDKEIYEGLVLVDFVPTSENLSKWLFEIVQRKLEGYATVEKIEFWETPKSCSIYSE